MRSRVSIIVAFLFYISVEAQFIQVDTLSKPAGWMQRGTWGEFGVGLQAILPFEATHFVNNQSDPVLTWNLALRSRLADNWPMLSLRFHTMIGSSFSYGSSDLSLLCSVIALHGQRHLFMASCGLGMYSYRAEVITGQIGGNYTVVDRTTITIPYEISFIQAYSPAFFGCISLCGTFNLKQSTIGAGFSVWFGTPVYSVY